jgi:hypothetical protein
MKEKGTDEELHAEWIVSTPMVVEELLLLLSYLHLT